VARRSQIWCPEIFNTDQGSQLASDGFTSIFDEYQIKASKDDNGRRIDNGIVERLWRSVKYEEVYLNAYDDVVMARRSRNIGTCQFAVRRLKDMARPVYRRQVWWTGEGQMATGQLLPSGDPMGAAVEFIDKLRVGKISFERCKSHFGGAK
jgi:transposase InsO family protein